MTDILFYSRSEEYHEFSNFAKYPIKIENTIWPTTEHYFQAQKFNHSPETMELIRKADSPAVAKKLGGNRSFKLRADWESVKESVMKVAIAAKFTQHAKLKKLLLDTCDRKLVENSPKDFYWGCGNTGKGKNRLGVLLMELRVDLKKS